jgi:hypothetical protein
MRERKSLCKLDEWLSEKILEDSWGGVVVTLIIFTSGYILMYYLPEIMFYFQGYHIAPAVHKWRMTLFSALYLVILFFTVLKIIRLIRKKPLPSE